MSLKIYDTLKPQGNFPAVEAEDILMSDGKSLPEALAQLATKQEFEDLVTIVNKILEFLNLNIGDTYLVSSDGYILQDKNGLYLTVKESA